MIDGHSNTCTHDYHHITQSIQDLSDSTQQNDLHSIEENTSSFADDTTTPCDFNITGQYLDTENASDTNACYMPKQPGIHSQQKHTYRNTFGESNIQYHDFDNQDSLTFSDKYTALLQQEITKSILEFTGSNNDQKLPVLKRYGHRDDARCNVFHRQLRHSY